VEDAWASAVQSERELAWAKTQIWGLVGRLEFERAERNPEFSKRNVEFVTRHGRELASAVSVSMGETGCNATSYARRELSSASGGQGSGKPSRPSGRPRGRRACASLRRTRTAAWGAPKRKPPSAGSGDTGGSGNAPKPSTTWARRRRGRKSACWGPGSQVHGCPPRPGRRLPGAKQRRSGCGRGKSSLSYSTTGGQASQSLHPRAKPKDGRSRAGRSQSRMCYARHNEQDERCVGPRGNGARGSMA